jgi:chromosome segregation ATPase
MSSFDEVTTLPGPSDAYRRIDSNPVNFLTLAKRLAIAEHTISEVAPRAARALEGTRDLAPLVRGLVNRVTKLEAAPKSGSSALEGILWEQVTDQKKQVERLNLFEKHVNGANRAVSQIAYRLEKLKEDLLSHHGELDNRVRILQKSMGGVGVGRGKKIENTLDRVLLRLEAVEARLEAVEEALTSPDSEKRKSTEEVIDSIAEFESPIAPLHGILTGKEYIPNPSESDQEQQIEARRAYRAQAWRDALANPPCHTVEPTEFW